MYSIFIHLHIHKLTADMPGCFLHTRTIVTYPLLSICYIDQIVFYCLLNTNMTCISDTGKHSEHLEINNTI